MKLNSRFILLLGLLLIALVGSIVSLTTAHEAQTKRSIALLQKEQAVQLDNILTLTAYPLQQYARDYSLWDEIVTFLGTRNAEWAQINLDASLDTFRLTGTWVFNLEGEEIYSSFRSPLTPTSNVLDRGALVERLRQSPFQHFYVRAGDALYEFQTAPIQPSSDTTRTTSPLGWLVAARYWDSSTLQNLAEITRAQVSLEAPGQSAEDASSGGIIEVTRKLNSLGGATAARLRLTFEPEQLTHLNRYGQHVLFVVLLQGIVVLIALVVGLRIWILAPFNRISDSLTRHDASSVEPLVHSRSELGHIARLVKEYFTAEAALKRSESALARALEERVRLGRELHDGVIQNIYAAGMGLAAARDIIKSDPETAGKKTDEVRTMLNETIREVRSYIMRLELADFQPKSFSQCVNEVVEAATPSEISPVAIQIDEAAAERLPVNLRTDALQKIRDWIQNGTRFRRVTKLDLKIYGRDANTVVTLVDNGTPPSEDSNESDSCSSNCRVTSEILPDGGQRTTISYTSS